MWVRGAGPYATVLADEVVKPGVEAVAIFRNVQRRVRTAIGQEPYLGFNSFSISPDKRTTTKSAQ
jgi:hypothetical protein